MCDRWKLFACDMDNAMPVIEFIGKLWFEEFVANEKCTASVVVAPGARVSVI